MSSPLRRSLPKAAANNTVKLPVGLRCRIAQAMTVEGFTVWSEFCRVALTEKCRTTEDRLRQRDPVTFERIYGIRADR